jgi:hypothetical protein
MVLEFAASLLPTMGAFAEPKRDVHRMGVARNHKSMKFKDLGKFKGWTLL